MTGTGQQHIMKSRVSQCLRNWGLSIRDYWQYRKEENVKNIGKKTLENLKSNIRGEGRRRW